MSVTTGRMWAAVLVLGLCLGGLSAQVAGQSTTTLPDNWQQSSQTDFAALCETWIAVTDLASQADKTTLAGYAWSTWLNDQTKAGALTPDQFMSLSTLAVSKLSNDDCQLLANVFSRRFPANTDVQPLSLTSLDRLTGPVAGRLGFTADQVNGWLQSWVDGHKGGTDLALADAARAWDLCHQHMASTAPVFQSLAQNMWTNYLQAAAGWNAVADADVMAYYNRLYGNLPAAATALLCQNVWARLNADPAQIVQQMTMRDFHVAYHQIVPQANVPMRQLVPLMANFVSAKGAQCTLNDLAEGVFLGSTFRHDAQLEATVTTIYQTTATTIVNQLSQATPVNGYDDDVSAWILGRAFESDTDRQQLTNLLSSAVLANRLAAAQILTWSYCYAGKIGDWKTQLSAKAADPQADADTKAFWLLVTADADEAQYWGADLQAPWPGNPNMDPQIWRKHQWLDKAFAAAQGEPMRLAILEEYASYFRAMRRPADGASLMASVIGQFTPDSAKTIKALQQSLQMFQGYLDATDQQAQAAGLKASQQLQLQYLQTCLMRSQAANNQQAIARLQTAISNLQAQMQQAGQ